MNRILEKGKIKVENQTKTRAWEGSSLCPETTTNGAAQEFYLCRAHCALWSLVTKSVSCPLYWIEWIIEWCRMPFLNLESLFLNDVGLHSENKKAYF